MSELDWRHDKWKPYGKDLEKALLSQEARACTTLSLRINELLSLPESIGSLTGLTKLSLQTNKLTSLPDCIGQLTNLTKLALECNQLTSLPDSIGQLTLLSELTVHDNQLTSISSGLGRLTNLLLLDLSHNRLASLPDCLGSLAELVNLYLSNNRLESLPHSMATLKKLQSLWLSHNIALPKQFRKKLNYDHTAVEELLSDIAIFYRHEMMRAAARRAALFVIARYGEGDLAVFPRDLIRLIANEVWKTRLADEWLDAGQRKETLIQRRRR